MIWDQEKNEWLKIYRQICFDDIAHILLDRKYLDILENPARVGQLIFNNYTYVVPFIVDKQGQIILKTIYPSRKFHKQYGGK